MCTLVHTLNCGFMYTPSVCAVHWVGFMYTPSVCAVHWVGLGKHFFNRGSIYCDGMHVMLFIKLIHAVFEKVINFLVNKPSLDYQMSWNLVHLSEGFTDTWSCVSEIGLLHGCCAVLSFAISACGSCVHMVFIVSIFNTTLY